MKVLPAKVNEPDYALAARGALQCKFVPATNAHENATDEQGRTDRSLAKAPGTPRKTV
jgi:hypothetical protein